MISMKDKNQLKTFYSTAKVMEYTLNNKNLIESKIPEITNDFGESVSLDSMVFPKSEKSATLITDPQNIYYHIDIFTLGKGAKINT